MDQLEQLIKDCKSGKQQAQSELYRKYAPQLFGVALRYARDKTEAEDSLHEAFITVFKKIEQYKGKGSFEGWMKRIVVNISLEKYRTRYRLQTVEDITTFDKRTYDEDVYDAINAEELMKLVVELPPKYKMVFNLYAIDGYNHKEIAEKLGISEGTSKSNLSRARGILQEKVKHLGYEKRIYAK